MIQALRRADRIVAPTSAMLDAVRACYTEADLGGRAFVIHNGLDAGRWPVGEHRQKPFVFAAGRVWDKAKNLAQLGAVAGEIECPIVIAGDGAEQGARQRTAAVLLGRVSRMRMAEYYRAAAAFAHPARYEPFGLAVLEAAASGCPLVLGDIPSLRELWDEAAVFVAPDDTAQLRGALARLLDDPYERTRLGDAARARALRYDARRMARAYMNHYQALLSRPVLAEGAA